MLKALSHQELRRQSRKQVREGSEGNFAVGEWGELRRQPVSTPPQLTSSDAIENGWVVIIIYIILSMGFKNYII